MGSIPLHVWSSRLSDLQKPDWCILDLDPKKAPFAYVIEVARAIRALCDDLELPCFIKTSGSTGLHVLLPLGGRCSYDQSKSLAELFARVIVDELPDIATITRNVGARGERVYIDFLQNGHGKLLVSALSVRPVPGALVSTPLEWSEVDETLDPKRFTIRTVPSRLRAMKRDPVIDVLTERPKLPVILERLAARLQGKSGS
jgi:bifunctional non-homologous end joining protein LigD